jgi:hypothetical protein
MSTYGNPKYLLNSWIAYHSSYESPLPLLLKSRMLGWDSRYGNESLAFVKRYDWGYHFYGDNDTAQSTPSQDGVRLLSGGNVCEKSTSTVRRTTQILIAGTE